MPNDHAQPSEIQRIAALHARISSDPESITPAEHEELMEMFFVEVARRFHRAGKRSSPVPKGTNPDTQGDEGDALKRARARLAREGIDLDAMFGVSED